jgi:hypothetical protein
MKDRLQLIFVGGVVAVVAWTFWHILGKDAFSALPTIMLIVVATDNLRLRRQLRSHTAAQSNDT